MTMFGLSDHEVGTYTQASMVQSLLNPCIAPASFSISCRFSIPGGRGVIWLNPKPYTLGTKHQGYRVLLWLLV